MKKNVMHLSNNRKKKTVPSTLFIFEALDNILRAAVERDSLLLLKDELNRTLAEINAKLDIYKC